MSSAPTSELVLAPEQKYWTGNQVAALRQLGVADDTPGADLAIFFHQAVRTGLDPFSKQIYLMQRRSKDRSGNWVPKSTIQTGIDGYRLIARKAATKAAVEFDYGPTEWCGQDGEWKDVWVGPGNPVAARVILYVGEKNRAFPAIAHYSEYVQLTKDGTPNSMWEKMSASQLEKCAEAKALRKAFPLDLSGIYTDDEMDQAADELADLGETSGTPTPAAEAEKVPVQRKTRTPRAKAPEPTTPTPEAHAPAAEPEDLGEKEPEETAADTDGVLPEPEADPAKPDPEDPAQPPADYDGTAAEDEGPAAVLEADAEPEAAPTTEPAEPEKPKAVPFKQCTPGQFRKMVELTTQAYPDAPEMRMFLAEWFRVARGLDRTPPALPGPDDTSRDEAVNLIAHLEALLAGELPGV